MVLSTIQLFLQLSTDLLPTPAKSHYTFNLRDVSKVFQVMLLCLSLSLVPAPIEAHVHDAVKRNSFLASLPVRPLLQLVSLMPGAAGFP